jgi:hypothetical protein
LERGSFLLDKDLIRKFLHKAKDLFKIWYNPDKKFKIRPSGKYPTNSLRTSYRYIVAMLCRLHGEHDTSKFTLSMIPLIYYYANMGSTFNWPNIISTSLEDSIRTVKENIVNKFTSFHMSSYLLDMVCVCHQYPKMEWAWKPTNLPIQIYYKVCWEHKYRTKYHKICDYFLAPLYQCIFDSPTPCMTNKTREIV